MKPEQHYIIYYNEESKRVAESLSWATPYDNSNKTDVCFENRVMVELWEEGKLDAEYNSVLSWMFPAKFGCNHPFELKGDVIRFNAQINVDLCRQADNWHPRFSELFIPIAKQIDLPYGVAKYPIYSNAFIARKEVWDEYIPVLKRFIEFIPEQALTDSGYHKKKMLSSHLIKTIGVPYYPYHPFLLERVFSYFLQTKNYEVLTYSPFKGTARAGVSRI